MRTERLSDMERYILQHGTSTLEDLCRHFDVSMSTVRRDVALLSRRRNIRKVYGGVAADRRPPALLADANYERYRYAGDNKTTIGCLAAALAQDDMSIFLDSGTTTLCLLPNLSGKRNITVVSYSLRALCEAAKYPALHVIALGGVYDPAAAAFVGGGILDELSKMSIDLIFLSADGVTLERGLTSATYSGAAMKRSVVQWNKRLVLMAESEKFGHDALLSFCCFEDLSVIVTDRPLPDAYRAGGSPGGVRVLSPQHLDASPCAAPSLPN